MSIEEMIEFVEETKRNIVLTDKGNQYISNIFEAVAQNDKRIGEAEKEIREFVIAILTFLNSIGLSEKIKVKKRPIKKKAD